MYSGPHILTYSVSGLLCIASIVQLFILWLFFLGGMAMDVADNAFELSRDASFSDSGCELSSQSADNIDETNVVSLSMDTSSGGPYKVHKQSQHSRVDHDNIPLCVGFGRKQWVGLDVAILNELGVLVADGICRNYDPCECVDAIPLVSMMLVCSLEKVV